MPVKPENKSLYPPNWKEIVERIRERAANKCEGCGLPNYAWVHSKTRELCLPDEDNAIRIICTTAHLDHNPANVDDENLRFWCQKCHNSYDAPHRAETRKKSKFINQSKLF